MYKVMYWKYSKKESIQIWKEYDNKKLAINCLERIGRKGNYCELYENDKIIDYRN